MPQYRLFSWGANSHGQLGQGDIKEEELLVPREVDLSSTGLQPKNIVKIVGGAGHSLLLDNAGRVFSCGWNNKGQAGVTNASSHFQRMAVVPEGEEIVDIACGWDSSMALTKSGELFTWGSNSHGQLGLTHAAIGAKVNKLSKVEFAKPVQRISMGLRHSAVITKDARVFVCGAATKGQLGIDFRGGRYSGQFVEVSQIQSARYVACGQHHTVVVTSDNEIFAWGDNKYGQLGVDPAIRALSLTPVKINNYEGTMSIRGIFCGWTHSAVLTADNKVFCWGRNSYGQLGRGQSVQAVETWEATVPVTSTSIQQLAVGSEHNVALLDDKTVVSWGWNEHGNCGNGSVENVFVPTKIVSLELKSVLIGTGAGHSFAVALTSS
ncbi:secretion-regulating guanine nucleotide exchange factor [Phymastichus coffea]|uniref:secretion-regulating guanine nucleotide exchange factor n=1 Tax=Phymastichus coffea TaxID=108790 RepID=UPI00273BF4E3|nr:secretion-regulating guanine nucleotide exchange factor [Phymastichus coffea]